MQNLHISQTYLAPFGQRDRQCFDFWGCCGAHRIHRKRKSERRFSADRNRNTISLFRQANYLSKRCRGEFCLYDVTNLSTQD